MEPALKQGEFVWVYTWAYLFSSPKINDLVVIHYQQKNLVKRVVKVFEKSFLVAGDNRKDTIILENGGEIENSDLIGKVLFKTN